MVRIMRWSPGYEERPGSRRVSVDAGCGGVRVAPSGSSTLSEIVVPVFDRAGNLRAVLDVDSDLPAAFDATDQLELEAICKAIGDHMAD